MSAPILEARNLTRSFDGFVALDGVDLAVREGELHAVIGPNGAGKTTLFNLLSGELLPTRGQILWRGQDVTRLPAHRRAHLGIGRCFQLTNLFPQLSARENVRLAVQARLHRASRGRPPSLRLGLLPADRLYDVERETDRILARVGLSGRAAVPSCQLSHGDQRKLELAVLLGTDPDLLLLDEPTAGMAQEDVPAFLELIRGLREEDRRTVLLVEHRIEAVLALADRITVLHLGRVIASGTPAEIVTHPDVQAAYLGEVPAVAAGR